MRVADVLRRVWRGAPAQVAPPPVLRGRLGRLCAERHDARYDRVDKVREDVLLERLDVAGADVRLARLCALGQHAVHEPRRCVHRGERLAARPVQRADVLVVELLERMEERVLADLHQLGERLAERRARADRLLHCRGVETQQQVEAQHDHRVRLCFERLQDARLHRAAASRDVAVEHAAHERVEHRPVQRRLSRAQQRPGPTEVYAKVEAAVPLADAPAVPEARCARRARRRCETQQERRDELALVREQLVHPREDIGDVPRRVVRVHLDGARQVRRRPAADGEGAHKRVGQRRRTRLGKRGECAAKEVLAVHEARECLAQQRARLGAFERQAPHRRRRKVRDAAVGRVEARGRARTHVVRGPRLVGNRPRRRVAGAIDQEERLVEDMLEAVHRRKVRERHVAVERRLFVCREYEARDEARGKVLVQPRRGAG